MYGGAGADVWAPTPGATAGAAASAAAMRPSSRRVIWDKRSSFQDDHVGIFAVCYWPGTRRFSSSNQLSATLICVGAEV